MASLKTRFIRLVYRKLAEWRRNIADASPPLAHKIFVLIADYLDMIFIDHGIFRILYANRHKLSDGVWRSSQPWPHQIRYYASKGIKTLVNLRGVRDCGSYRLEVKACEQYGINLVNFKMVSHKAPSPDMLRDFKEVFDNLEYPILIHCKSGADRVGLASALYLFVRENSSYEEAVDQLHFRFGHFKQAKTGILDYFFQRYRDYNKEHPISFLEWVERVYDPDETKTSFRSQAWANTLVDSILRRE